MKVMTKTVLITDRKKDPIQPGKEVDLPDKEARRLLAKGLVELPAVEEAAEKDNAGNENAGNGVGTGNEAGNEK